MDGEANFRIEILNEAPPVVRRGKQMDRRTLELVETIKANKGKVLKLEFEEKADLIRWSHRIRSIKKKKLASFEKLQRSDKTLYIITS